MGKADDIVKKDRLTTKTLTTDCEKQKKKELASKNMQQTETLEWISISNDLNKKKKIRQLIGGQSGIYEGFRKFHFGNIRNQSRSVTYDGGLDH